MLKLKLQYFGHLMGKANSLKKILMMGKIEGKRRRGWQRMRWLHSITYSIDLSMGKLWEIVKGSQGELQSMDQKEQDTIEWLNNNKTITRVSDSVGWRQSPKSLHFQQIHKWCWSYWFGDQTFKSTAIDSSGLCERLSTFGFYGRHSCWLLIQYPFPLLLTNRLRFYSRRQCKCYLSQVHCC